MHPVSFDLEYSLSRNRLSTFFRLIIAIPWMLVSFLYSLAAAVATLIAWFALVFTTRYPEGLYGFVAGYLRYSTRVGAFVALATDELPPFSGGENTGYPVRIAVGPRQASYDRLKTFFKLITAVPQFLLGYGISYLTGAAAFVSWWRIVFTGRQSATMHDALRAGLAYQSRSNGFLMLLTETHPRLLDLPPQVYPADAPAPGQAPLGA